jgi:hypothetical protein
MNIGIVSIQRNRNKWILEWLAFYRAMGVNKFYIYCHLCNDGMPETLAALSKAIDIKIHIVGDIEKPQLKCYQHAIDNYNNQVDWMAFLDGDEFLYSPSYTRLDLALENIPFSGFSAIAAYWQCYGSSGHYADPDGLIIDNYRRHSRNDFIYNRHVKSILRGGETAIANTSHVFLTGKGTYDTKMRSVITGFNPDTEPSYELLRINHYAVQSYEFYINTKKSIGAADGNKNLIRHEEWFNTFDRNENDDGESYKLSITTKKSLSELYTFDKNKV